MRESALNKGVDSPLQNQIIAPHANLSYQSLKYRYQ